MGVVERILQLIERNGITAAQLLRDTSLSPATMTHWKKGSNGPSADAVFKIANYFGVSTDYLLSGNEFGGAITLESSTLVIPLKLQEVYNDIYEARGVFSQAELNEIADFISFIELKRESRKKEAEHIKVKKAPNLKETKEQ